MLTSSLPRRKWRYHSIIEKAVKCLLVYTYVISYVTFGNEKETLVIPKAFRAQVICHIKYVDLAQGHSAF